MSVSCRDYTTELVCFNDGANSRQLIAHYEYAKGSSNSILLATRYTEADGVTVVNTTIGTVIPGECCKPIIQYFQKFYYDSALDECTPIKEAITTLCDGSQTYQYLMEDGAGGFTDATTTIAGWDESNVFIQSCVQQQSINNSPITTLVNNNSTFTITTDFFSVSYVVIGSGATIETPHNSFTRNLFDGESGEFRADDGKTLDNTIIFTTTTNSKIIINAIIRI